MKNPLESLDWRAIRAARWVQMPNGYGLWIRENEAGGRTYASDEIGGGVTVWDTALVNRSTLLFALAIEDSIDAIPSAGNHQR